MSDFDLDLTDIDPDRIDNRAGKFPIGQFHVQVNSFRGYGGKNGETIVQLQSLASNVPGTEGMTHDEYFHDNVVARKMLLQIAIACRLVTRDEIKSLKEKTGRAKLDWDQLEGRQFLMTTISNVDKTNPSKSYINIEQIFDVDDERAKNIPKHDVLLKRFKSAYPLKESKPANGQHAASPAAPTQQPATAEGSFDDMFA